MSLKYSQLNRLIPTWFIPLSTFPFFTSDCTSWNGLLTLWISDGFYTTRYTFEGIRVRVKILLSGCIGLCSSMSVLL